MLICLFSIVWGGCSKEDDFELPSFAQAVGKYEGNYVAYKNGDVINEGEAAVTADLTSEEARPIALQSFGLCVETQIIDFNLNCRINQDENGYSWREEKVATIPGVIGFYEYKSVISGKLDGRTLSFVWNRIISNANSSSAVRVVFNGKKVEHEYTLSGLFISY
ncbi:hypothetical protein JCM17136A_02130 [Phocaeicola sartorii JCM 17136 = DSM 21941]